MTREEETEIRAHDAVVQDIPRSKRMFAEVHRTALLAALDEARRERDEARKAAEERDGDMHARIRAGYDRTIADSWRAKVAEVERARDQFADDAAALALEAERARKERDAARDAHCALLDALMSSSDEVRRAGVAQAMRDREGWGR